MQDWGAVCRDEVKQGLSEGVQGQVWGHTETEMPIRFWLFLPFVHSMSCSSSKMRTLLTKVTPPTTPGCLTADPQRE